MDISLIELRLALGRQRFGSSYGLLMQRPPLPTPPDNRPGEPADQPGKSAHEAPERDSMEAAPTDRAFELSGDLKGGNPIGHQDGEKP